MGDFDFIGDQSPSRSYSRPARRKVVYRDRKPSGCGMAVSVCFGILLAVAVLFGGCVFIVGSAAKRIAEEGGGGSFMEKVHEDVLRDAVRQYRAVLKGGGSDIDAHLRAGLVAEACLQSGDDEGYAEWIKIRDAHARRAGLPVP